MYKNLGCRDKSSSVHTRKKNEKKRKGGMRGRDGVRRAHRGVIHEIIMRVSWEAVGLVGVFEHPAISENQAGVQGETLCVPSRNKGWVIYGQEVFCFFLVEVMMGGNISSHRPGGKGRERPSRVAGFCSMTVR